MSSSLSLKVTICDVKLNEPNKYFVVLTLDSGAFDPKDKSNLRTEVCKEVTATPQFQKKSIEIKVVDDFTSKTANLKGGAFKVTKDPAKTLDEGSKEDKVALEGNCEVAVYEHMSELGDGKKVHVQVPFKDPTEGKLLGTMDLDLQLVKHSEDGRGGSISPAPAPVPSPAPAPPKPAPAPAPGTRGPQDPQPVAPSQPRMQTRTAPARQPAAAAAPSGAPPFRVVTLVVRHAINLPVSGHGEEAVLPTPFVAVKSQRDAASKKVRWSLFPQYGAGLSLSVACAGSRPNRRRRRCATAAIRSGIRRWWWRCWRTICSGRRATSSSR